MSTDRELLEAAARAAGISVGPEDFTDPIGRKYSDGLGLWVHPSYGRWWNPLGDDGDALRLAVKLKLEVMVDDYQIVAASSAWHEHGADVPGASEPTGVDDYAATRRAIVRAAAAALVAQGAEP